MQAHANTAMPVVYWGRGERIDSNWLIVNGIGKGASARQWETVGMLLLS
jgi:hypothetical protein